MANRLMQKLDGIHEARSITAAFLLFNYSLSTGNLFFEKRLWDELDGFRDYRYNHDWDFCLRASLLTPPAILFEPQYFYRIHGGNTISESRPATTLEADRLFGDWQSEIMKRLNDHPETARRIISAQYIREWRLLEGGRGHLIEPHKLVELAENFLSSFASNV